MKWMLVCFFIGGCFGNEPKAENEASFYTQQECAAAAKAKNEQVAEEEYFNGPVHVSYLCVENPIYSGVRYP
ncbi:hypothetical protein OJF2_51290 [Aquisphaera giovannonii]|uniref:Uncharacterized protein n=1 Tax=Aquisphaera giovannonii TaxID=406548 RepID=A0A5B9W8W9_9BACT|nr:hypothetical protein [Aquisphaera giovannonii]QEH36545.1 hypothetical protein OJF2_51290 [Aquisphaera giovannonii]